MDESAPSGPIVRYERGRPRRAADDGRIRARRSARMLSRDDQCETTHGPGEDLIRRAAAFRLAGSGSLPREQTCDGYRNTGHSACLACVQAVWNRAR